MEYRENDKLIASAVGEYKVIIYANYACTRIGIGYSKSNRILLNPLTVWDGLKIFVSIGLQIHGVTHLEILRIWLVMVLNCIPMVKFVSVRL